MLNEEYILRLIRRLKAIPGPFNLLSFASSIELTARRDACNECSAYLKSRAKSADKETGLSEHDRIILKKIYEKDAENLRNIW